MSGKPIGAEDIAVLRRLQAALPDVGLNGWFVGVEVLDRVIEHLTAAQQQGQAVPCRWPSCECPNGTAECPKRTAPPPSVPEIDLEAIAWAYRKLLDFGCYSSEQGAMMGDRLNLMLLAAAPSAKGVG